MYQIATTLYGMSTGKTMNPANPTDAEFFDPMQVGYILRNATNPNAKPIVFTSFGHLRNVEVFSQVQIGHRRYDVIGAVDFAMQSTIGEVPNRKLAHHVAK